MASHRYIALLGRPNAGKSTLFNRLLGERVAAVTHKPHTTRCNIRGALDLGDIRAVLVDTPGLHRGGRHRLNRVLNGNIAHALECVRACVLLSDCRHWGADDEAALELIKRSEKPCVLVLNKVDLIGDKTKLVDVLKERDGLHDFHALIPMSARYDKSMDAVKREIAEVLSGEAEDGESDFGVGESGRELAGELIREQLMLDTHAEVPYASHVEVVEYERRGKTLYCAAKIIVERESQRAIVVGRGGRSIKHIGGRARRAMQAVLGSPVYLDLKVSVVGAWRNDPEIVRSYMDDTPA